MRKCFKIFTIMLAMMFSVTVMAQTQPYREMHKVKKKETLFGIAQKYGITVDELTKANPEMKMPDYKLKKGDYIYIPYPTPQPTIQVSANTVKVAKDDITQRAIRVGVILPLHNVDGDGRRMVEYYRGLLMACNDLKNENISVDVHAWNIDIDHDINTFITNPELAKCDILFGPLYTKQMDALSKFVQQQHIKLVIPFSIEGTHVADNPYIFQVYQRPEVLNQTTINCFMARFAGYHPVFIDCNDKTSTKGAFTTGLRKELEAKKITANITNLNNSEEVFAKAFATDKPNVVILNTGRSPELNSAFAKLDQLLKSHPNIRVSLFGYQEWLLYEKYDMENFSRFDTYIPTYFYYNTVAAKTQQLENSYRRSFGVSMQDAKPRFALTGYDQAMFFLRGLHQKGWNFVGTEQSVGNVQTNYRFVKVGDRGGYQNNYFMFIHYNRNKSISTIVY
ncbi:MAG: LysM peptidoglycan-binding domain-containing protein [Prevotella sp.]|nr:LysM peptidoglycan-binding domain-containing protein [Prevotella sp.]